MQEALQAGGVAPEHLVNRVLPELQRLLNLTTAGDGQEPPEAGEAARPLLGMLQAQTHLPPSAIARAMDVPVTFLAAVSRHPHVVPRRWQQELARRAEEALQVQPRLVLESLTRPFQSARAADRDTPYATNTVQSYEDILLQSTLSNDARHYWQRLAMDAST